MFWKAPRSSEVSREGTGEEGQLAAFWLFDNAAWCWVVWNLDSASVSASVSVLYLRRIVHRSLVQQNSTIDIPMSGPKHCQLGSRMCYICTCLRAWICVDCALYTVNREWNRIRIRIEFEFELKFELWINLSCRLWSIVNCLILQCCVELASGWSVTEVESIVLWCGTWLTTWPLRHGKKKLTRRNCPACCVATGITTVGDRALWWQAANCNQTLLRTTCETWRCEVWVCVSVWVCQLSDFARRCFFLLCLQSELWALSLSLT